MNRQGKKPFVPSATKKSSSRHHRKILRPQTRRRSATSSTTSRHPLPRMYRQSRICRICRSAASIWFCVILGGSLERGMFSPDYFETAIEFSSQVCDTTTPVSTRRSRMSQVMKRKLRVVGVFAGIGGIERGLGIHGHSAKLLVEIDIAAQTILRKRFPHADIAGDVRMVKSLPDCDLVCAGFPCQDLSQCGKAEGITGKHSSLIGEVFRLVATTKKRPAWLLLENVPFMLQLDRGKAMTFVTDELQRLGYRWAYRTVDARSFGVPQRRLRVVLVASREADPKQVLFASSHPEPPNSTNATAYGFYWTEGSKGLGWGVNCVPTIKGGSGLGIPSPPAIWIPRERRIVTIDIRDAERLQGLPAGWTAPAVHKLGERVGTRWRLVGNAVCGKVAAWIGRQLASPGKWQPSMLGDAVPTAGPWPPAACSDGNGPRAVSASAWPVLYQSRGLLSFLRYPTRQLSERASIGFLSRAKSSKLRFAAGFLDDVAYHINELSREVSAPGEPHACSRRPI